MDVRARGAGAVDSGVPANEGSPPGAGAGVNPLRDVGAVTVRNGDAPGNEQGVPYRRRGPPAPREAVGEACQGPGVHISYGMAGRSGRVVGDAIVLSPKASCQP